MGLCGSSAATKESPPTEKPKPSPDNAKPSDATVNSNPNAAKATPKEDKPAPSNNPGSPGSPKEIRFHQDVKLELKDASGDSSKPDAGSVKAGNSDGAQPAASGPTHQRGASGAVPAPERGRLRELSHDRKQAKRDTMQPAATDGASGAAGGSSEPALPEKHEPVQRTLSAEDEVLHDAGKELKSKEQMAAEIQQLKQKKRSSMFGAVPKNTKRGSYDYMAIIGKGSFGQVVLVRTKSPPFVHYAMKIMDIKKQKKLLHAEKPAMGRKVSIMAEEKVMQYLDHCFIVSLHEHFQTGTHQFIVLELVQGPTLSDVLEGGKILPLETARKYAAEILLALSYIHDLKIVHRDLKPDNLMVARTGHIKLMDFGVSFNVGDFAHSDRKIGAKGFKAPEMLSGKDYEYSIDYWNFGVILYLMLCGKHPFYRSGLFSGDEDSNALKSAVTYPKTLPEEARDLIAKLLVREPKNRLGSGGTTGQSHPEEVQVHPFFAGLDWEKLLDTGEKERFDNFDNFPKDEKPEFADVDDVIQRFEDTDPAAQLERLGLSEF